MPAVPEDVRSATRAKAEGRATSDLHADLAALDPATAARLRPSDRQRTLRALEVFAATGRPLASFQGARAAPALPSGRMGGPLSGPGPRSSLPAHRCAASTRCSKEGARDEAAALMERRLDPALPVMRAHGVPHLIDHFEGRLSLAEAAERAKLDTRHYAKRQFTWASHQLTGFDWVAPEPAIETGMRAIGDVGLRLRRDRRPRRFAVRSILARGRVSVCK